MREFHGSIFETWYLLEEVGVVRMESKHKHLELIQGIINRLSNNSFLLKGWSVFLVSALFALSAPEARVAFVYIAYIPAIFFWGLDGFFLWQERLFRKLYDRVRLLSDNEIDFSMDTSVIEGNDRPTWGGATLSKTLIPFHGVLIFSVVVVMALTTKG